MDFFLLEEVKICGNKNNNKNNRVKGTYMHAYKLPTYIKAQTFKLKIHNWNTSCCFGLFSYVIFTHYSIDMR